MGWDRGLDRPAVRLHRGLVRIGEVARDLGVSADTLRFYERSGLLPQPGRTESGYRDYGAAEVERIRLMLDLRRLDLAPADAARIAGWCQSGHCSEASQALPEVLSLRRAAIRERIEGLQALERRLAMLEAHLSLQGLPMAGAAGPCCSAAAAVEHAVDH
jgi:MerR family transcriptional regulator, copper efflux regulator